MKCMECGEEMVRSLDPIQSVFKGENIKIEGVEHWKCMHCGEVEFGSDDLDALDEAENQAYRVMRHLLSPKEIKELRSRYGLKQSQLEEMLGLTSPTVSRWETGAVIQSKLADNLMRLMGELPQAAEMMASRAGVSLSKVHMSSSAKYGKPKVCIQWNIPMDEWAAFASNSKHSQFSSSKVSLSSNDPFRSRLHGERPSLKSQIEAA